MSVSKPPSWYPDLRSRARVDAARGAVRDAVGGLRNLEQLSGSMRVGPRSLSSVLPDVRASCEPLQAALDELLTLIASQSSHTRATLQTLREYYSPRILELSEFLTGAQGKPMQARNRLHLQQVITRLSREISLAAELVDFLGLSVWTQPMAITLQDVLFEAFRTTQPTGDAVYMRKVTLQPNFGDLELHTSPRAAVAVLVMLVRIILDRHPQSVPHIELQSIREGFVRIIMSAAAGTGESRWILGRPVVPAALECVQLVTNTLRAEMELSSNADRAVVEFAATPASQPPHNDE
jgi:hypothetical protein